jgi:hypothetical protein
MATTAKGYPYPATTDSNNVPADLQSLAEKNDDRPGISPLTTSARDGLTGADLWDGRVIFNLTAARLERYNAAVPAWQAAGISETGGSFTGPVDAPEVGIVGPNGRGRLVAAPAGRNYVTLEAPGGASSFTAYATDDANFPGRWAILNALTQFCLSATAPDQRDIRAHGNVDVVGGITSAGDIKVANTSLPRGVRAFKNGLASTGDLGDNVLVPGYALSFTAEARRFYRVIMEAGVVDDQAGTSSTFAGGVDFRIHSENGATAVATTSPSRGYQRVPLYGNASNHAEGLHVVGYINNPPAGNVNVALSGKVVTPATLWRLLQASSGEGSMIVEDIGAAR